MHQNTKRILAGILAGGMMLSFAACGDQKGNDDTQLQGSGGAVFDKPTEIKIAISSHPSWPYNENWKMWQYLQEATGAVTKVQAIPDSDFDTKVSLMMASPSELPDLLHFTHKYSVDQYTSSGALVAIDDNLDKMPNYVKFFDSLPQEQADEMKMQRRSGDGKIYAPPVYGTQTVNGLRTWIYRKDIFEKENLAVPTTYDEVYETAKILKERYPNSYPLCFREGMDKLRMMGSQWKEYFSYDIYYDFNEKKWSYGVTEPIMKDVVTYLRKLYDEKLVPLDFLTMNTKTWEELMSTDRGFITIDYIVRIDYFNLLSRKENPAYTLATMEPPAANVSTGKRQLPQLNFDFTGYTVCNTGDSERIDNAFKLLDWMYSDEGAELMGWGKEGETYEVVDGKKQFILPNPDDTPRSLYGAGSYGLYQRMDVAANEAGYTEEQITECHKALQYTEAHANPMWWLPFNDEEQQRKAELSTEIDEYVKEMLSKFIMGQEPLSKWDQFQKELHEMNIDELVSIFDTAYARVMG